MYPCGISRGWGELALRKSLLVSSRQKGRASATWTNLTEACFFSAQANNPESWAEQPETGSCLFCSSADTAEEIKFSGFLCLHMGSLTFSATHQAENVVYLAIYIHLRYIPNLQWFEIQDLLNQRSHIFVLSNTWWSFLPLICLIFILNPCTFLASATFCSKDIDSLIWFFLFTFSMLPCFGRDRSGTGLHRCFWNGTTR